MPEADRRPRVVAVRHGETAWSREGKHTSHTDVPLTERGRVQAQRLGHALSTGRFAQVWTSPRRRAIETADLAGFGPVAEVRDDLSEWDYGDFEGRTTDAIRAEIPGFTIWNVACPGGETIASVAARADRVIAAARAAGGDVLLFGHAHQLRVLAARWCGLAPVIGRSLALDPASVSVLAYERETPVIRRWNETAELSG